MTTTNFSLPVIREGLTKTKIKELADSSVSIVLEEGNCFEVAEVISSMEDFIKSVRSDERFINYLRDELQKNNGKLTLPSGAKLEVCETGVTYNYSNNPEWVELETKVKELTEKKKELEEKLKRIPAGKILVDETTGESLVGPAKTSKSNYKLTLPK